VFWTGSEVTSSESCCNSTSSISICKDFWHLTQTPRVEAGDNTSTAVPASRKRRRRGNTVSDETVMYGYWSSVTWPVSDCKLQTRPLVREGALQEEQQSNCHYRKDKDKIWSWAPKGSTIPRRTGRLIVGRKIYSTQLNSTLRQTEPLGISRKRNWVELAHNTVQCSVFINTLINKCLHWKYGIYCPTGVDMNFWRRIQNNGVIKLQKLFSWYSIVCICKGFIAKSTKDRMCKPLSAVRMVSTSKPRVRKPHVPVDQSLTN
jgi:hypothetical protein